jgi:hypothetical protein
MSARAARTSGVAGTAAKDEPSSDDDDKGANYDVFYQRLGMN